MDVMNTVSYFIQIIFLAWALFMVLGAALTMDRGEGNKPVRRAFFFLIIAAICFIEFLKRFVEVFL